jgi:hypothetical protein
MALLRPRFRLKTLLVVLAVAAISCAGIWQFWPQWRAHRARVRFESGAARFRAGMTVTDITAIVGPGDWTSYSSDAQGRMVALSPYFLEGAWYCVYVQLDSKSRERIGSHIPSLSVTTYRLAVPPKDYMPQTQAAKERVNPSERVRGTSRLPKGAINLGARALKGEEARRTAYIKDFYMHITGYAKEDLGIRYEEVPGSSSKTAE